MSEHVQLTSLRVAKSVAKPGEPTSLLLVFDHEQAIPDEYYRYCHHFTKFQLYRCESPDNKTWGEWDWHKEIIPNKELYPGENGKRWAITVTAPTTLGHFYKYFLKYSYTVDGQEHQSAWFEAENSLRAGMDTSDPWTDNPLVAGETAVKAVHMTELQDRVNALRPHYGAARVTFTPAVAEITPLALWTQQVEELRAALDEINSQGVEWLEIPVNCPRADVMTQLRAVIESL